jgi:hypothetical protein
MSENLNKIIAQYGTVKGKLIDTTRPVERRDEQNRPDAQVKLSKFMTAEDIAHCPPSDNDWLVAFNDHSLHGTVIGLLSEAITARRLRFPEGFTLDWSKESLTGQS